MLMLCNRCLVISVARSRGRRLIVKDNERKSFRSLNLHIPWPFLIVLLTASELIVPIDPSRLYCVSAGENPYC
jgi:hypothetical protein